MQQVDGLGNAYKPSCYKDQLHNHKDGAWERGDGQLAFLWFKMAPESVLPNLPPSFALNLVMEGGLPKPVLLLYKGHFWLCCGCELNG